MSPRSPRSSGNRLDTVNAALGGSLAEEVKAKRAAGISFAEIAADLRTRNIAVSDETVRRFSNANGLEPHKPEKASA